jgi:hypothetical protein
VDNAVMSADAMGRLFAGVRDGQAQKKHNETLA